MATIKFDLAELKSAIKKIKLLVPKKPIAECLEYALITKSGIMFNNIYSHIFIVFETEFSKDFTEIAVKISDLETVVGSVKLKKKEKREVLLHIENGECSGIVDRLSLKITLMDVKEYPDFFSCDALKVFSINSKDFSESLNSVSYAACNDETKRAFCGINFHNEATELQIRAAGNNRLAVNSTGRYCGEMRDFTIETDIAKKIEKFFDKEIDCNLSEDSVRFYNDTVYFTTRIL